MLLSERCFTVGDWARIAHMLTLKDCCVFVCFFFSLSCLLSLWPWLSHDFLVLASLLFPNNEAPRSCHWSLPVRTKGSLSTIGVTGETANKHIKSDSRPNYDTKPPLQWDPQVPQLFPKWCGNGSEFCCVVLYEPCTIHIRCNMKKIKIVTCVRCSWLTLFFLSHF